MLTFAGMVGLDPLAGVPELSEAVLEKIAQCRHPHQIVGGLAVVPLPREIARGLPFARGEVAAAHPHHGDHVDDLIVIEIVDRFSQFRGEGAVSVALERIGLSRIRRARFEVGPDRIRGGVELARHFDDIADLLSTDVDLDRPLVFDYCHGILASTRSEPAALNWPRSST
jgi:hypothetical protein